MPVFVGKAAAGVTVGDGIPIGVAVPVGKAAAGVTAVVSLHDTSSASKKMIAR
jgi:hypothetical protein